MVHPRGLERGHIHRADRRFRRRVVAQGLFQPENPAARKGETARGRNDGRAGLSVDLFERRHASGFALQRIVGERVVGGHAGLFVGEQVQAQMLNIERARAVETAHMRQHHLRDRRRAQARHVGLHRDERVENVEQDADHRGQTHTLGARERVCQQQPTRRLQLFRQRRLLPDSRAIDFGDVGFGFAETRDGPEIGRQFAKALARHQTAVADGDEARQRERDPDVAEASQREHRFGPHGVGKVHRRQPQHEHHRHEHLHAERKRPATETRHEFRRRTRSRRSRRSRRRSTSRGVGCPSSRPARG